MEFQVHSIHFDADVKLINHINERMKKLDVFFDQITDGEVFLRLDKSDSNDNKVTEIKLNVPGKELFAKKQCKTFEEATDTAIEALRIQLQKHKEKIKG